MKVLRIFPLSDLAIPMVIFTNFQKIIHISFLFGESGTLFGN